MSAIAPSFVRTQEVPGTLTSFHEVAGRGASVLFLRGDPTIISRTVQNLGANSDGSDTQIWVGGRELQGTAVGSSAPNGGCRVARYDFSPIFNGACDLVVISTDSEIKAKVCVLEEKRK